MSAGILLDTHCWAWSLLNVNLPPRVVSAMENATLVFVSPVSVFEIAQKVRIGKWPEMEPLLPELRNALAFQDGVWAEMTPEIANFAGMLPWEHRDPFDRLLAATALQNGWDFISADSAFDTLTGLRRVW